MARRSRKARRGARPAEANGAEPSRPDPSRPDPSRADPSRAEPSRADPSRPDPSGAARVRRGYARSEERNEALRAGLTPLAPGERPLALTVAAVLAAALALANLVALALGAEVDGRRPSAIPTLIFGALMLGAAWGLWHRRYWAVLGFEALLGITLAFAGLSLMVASNVAALVLCVAILLGGGWLFWKLVRVMGRLQAPPRPG